MIQWGSFLKFVSKKTAGFSFFIFLLFLLLRRVHKICDKLLLASYCLSVRPHGTARIPLEIFLLKLVVEDFWKICREISSFINLYPANVENMVSS